MNNLDSNSIYKSLTAYFSDVEFVDGDTLIFLDEIQYCGSARTSIKFLASDFRFDVISSGSLLGLSYGTGGDSEVDKIESIPVGYERQITLYSLDFEEFLWANGIKENSLKVLREHFENDETIPNPINDKFEKLFKEFMFVGGMPEVVKAFVEKYDYNKVTEVQNKILSDYQDDISAHAKGAEKAKVRQCYDSIPKQLSKEMRKFQYGIVEKGQTSKKFGGSIK